jgi:hypothetical protein
MGPQEPQQPVAPAPQPQQPPQPQFQPQPPQPNAFGSGPAPVPGTPMPSAPKKGLSKGALFGIIGGAVALVLLVVGVILAITLLGGPAKDDYRKAGDTLNSSITAYNKIGSESYELTSSSGTDSSRKNAIESMKKYQSDFNDKFQEAGKMKGIANDKDLKEKWNKVEEKRAKFNTSVEELFEVSEKVVPLMKEISNITSPTASQLSSIRERIEGIKVKNAPTNDYLTALAKYLKAAEDYANYRNAGSYDSSAYTKYSSALNDYYDATKDWSTAIKKMTDEAELKDSLNDLRDALVEKASSTK